MKAEAPGTSSAPGSSTATEARPGPDVAFALKVRSAPSSPVNPMSRVEPSGTELARVFDFVGVFVLKETVKTPVVLPPAVRTTAWRPVSDRGRFFNCGFAVPSPLVNPARGRLLPSGSSTEMTGRSDSPLPAATFTESRPPSERSRTKASESPAGERLPVSLSPLTAGTPRFGAARAAAARAARAARAAAEHRMCMASPFGGPL